MRFRFSLQRLLELRLERERAVARDLVSARDAADAEHRQHEALLHAHEAAQHRLAVETAGSATIGTLVSLNYALSQFGEHVAAADERTRVADASVARTHDALTAAAQARQMLDRLRVRHLEDFTADEKSTDRRTMDDVALARYVRRRDPHAPGTQRDS